MPLFKINLITVFFDSATLTNKGLF